MWGDGRPPVVRGKGGIIGRNEMVEDEHADASLHRNLSRIRGETVRGDEMLAQTGTVSGSPDNAVQPLRQHRLMHENVSPTGEVG